MILIGIETATERLSAALKIDGRIMSRHTDSRSSHCELLTGFIQELTDEAGIAIGDIDGVSVSLGPGSFTGLRIGIATGMGLAYSLGKKAAGVNTLEGMAWNSSVDNGLVCPLIDARRSEAYTGVYRVVRDSGMPETVIEAQAIQVSKLADILANLNEPVHITGPAAEIFRPLIDTTQSASLTFETGDTTKASAESIAEIGAAMFKQGMAVTPDRLEPIYLRRSDAEILRDKGC